MLWPLLLSRVTSDAPLLDHGGMASFAANPEFLAALPYPVKRQARLMLSTCR